MVLPINRGISSDLLKLFEFRADQSLASTLFLGKDIYR